MLVLLLLISLKTAALVEGESSLGRLSLCVNFTRGLILSSYVLRIEAIRIGCIGKLLGDTSGV